MSVMEVKLRDWANLQEADTLRFLETRRRVIVTDDEGKQQESDTFVLMLTWQGLIVHRHYNDVPYLLEELIPSNKVGDRPDIVYDDDTKAIPINMFLRRIMPTIHNPVEADAIKRLIHIWQNKLNNLSVVMSERSVISATDVSVAEFMEDEAIMDIRDRILAKEITIDEGEVEFTSLIRNPEYQPNNVMALLARTGAVSINQAYQKTVMRGGTFDLNNRIMPNAVVVPYAHGITNAADSLGERNASGKALSNNGKALKDSEWFHRKAHILTSVFQTILFMDDCGTNVTVPVKIANMQMAMAFLGKYRRLDDGRLQLIDNATVWDIKPGEVIQVRSVAFCNSKHTGKPCGTCYGMMKTAIPFNTMMMRSANVGMYSATAICNPMGQGMLSTKHFIRNAVTKRFEPVSKDRNIIYSNGDDIFLQPELCTPGSELVLRSEIVDVLSDVRSLDNLDSLSVDKLPHFAEVTFRYAVQDIMVGGTTLQQHSAKTSVSSRQARFSLEFLRYLLQVGWSTEGRKHIVIDLSGWNTLAPIFNLPYTREDLDMHRARVENMITFNKRNNAWKQQQVTPKIFGDVLAEYWSLINQEIRGINSVHVESLLYTCLATDPDRYDYSLPGGNSTRRFYNYQDCIKGRGAGMIMIYENQQGVLNDPTTFMTVNRQGSPLECFYTLAAN